MAQGLVCFFASLLQNHALTLLWTIQLATLLMELVSLIMQKPVVS